MIYEREDGKCSLEVPDRPTVRQQLNYFSTIGGTEGNYLLRWWVGAQSLITDWKCEALPDHKTDLDKITDPTQTDVIIWAGLKVREHMNALEDLSKN